MRAIYLVPSSRISRYLLPFSSNILLSTLFSYTLDLCSSLCVGKTKFHTHTTHSGYMYACLIVYLYLYFSFYVGG